MDNPPRKNENKEGSAGPSRSQTGSGGNDPKSKEKKKFDLSQLSAMMKSKFAQVKIAAKAYKPNLNIVRKKPAVVVKEPQGEEEAKCSVDDNDGENESEDKRTYVQLEGVFTGDCEEKRVEQPLTNETEGSKETVAESEVTQAEPMQDEPQKPAVKLVEPDISNPPLQLPVCMDTPLVDETQNLDALFKPLDQKTVAKSPRRDYDVKSTNEKCINDPALMSEIFDNTDKPKLLIFEFPDMFVKEPQPSTSGQASSFKTSKSSSQSSMLTGLRQGLWGKLQLHENGDAYLIAGDLKMRLILRRNPMKQTLMSTKIDKAKKEGEVIKMGTIDATFTCAYHFN